MESLPGGLLALNKTAEAAGFYTVAVTGVHHGTQQEKPLAALKGWRGAELEGGRFLALWIGGKAHAGYWWTVDQECVLPSGGEVYRWEAARPVAVRMGVNALRAKLSGK